MRIPDISRILDSKQSSFITHARQKTHLALCCEHMLPPRPNFEHASEPSPSGGFESFNNAQAGSIRPP